MSSEQNEQKGDALQNELNNDSSSSSNHTLQKTLPIAAAGAGAGTRPASISVEQPKNDSPFFYEDEVFRITRRGTVKFGLVVETPETYSGDEDDEYDPLKEGDVLVSWYPEADDSVVHENQLGLADRSLMPGDIVRRLVPGKNTQRGFCRDINLKADVKILGTRQVMKDIPSSRLRSVANWANNSAVCLDSWVGSAKHVEETAILRASSGAKIEVPSDRWHLFYQPDHRPHTDNQHFFIGNIVVGQVRDMLHFKKLTPELTVPTNKRGTARFTVESITTESVYVDWQCKALCEDQNISNSAIQQPARQISGKDLERLKRINLYDTCLLQINDRCYLNYSKDDVVIDRRVWKKEMYAKYKKLLTEQQEHMQRLNESGTAAPISNTNTLDKLRKKFNLPAENERTCKSKKSYHKIDKNKSKTSNLANNSSVDDPEWVSECETDAVDSKSVEEHESDQQSGGSNDTKTTSTSTRNTIKPYLPYITKKFYPIKKRSSSSLRKEHCLNDGDEAVVETLVVFSTVNVVWQDGTIEKDVPSTQLYPIHHLDSHEYFPGDYVCCTRDDVNYNINRDYGVVQKVDHIGRTAIVKWFTVYTCVKNPVPTYNGESEVSVYDLKDHPDFQFRVGAMVIRVANFVGADEKSTAGQVTECLTDGQLKVNWVDGHESNCWPQDLFEVAQTDAQSDDESGDSWETESENSEIGIQQSTPRKLSSSDSDFFANINKAHDHIAKLEKLFGKVLYEAEQENDAVSVGVLRKLIVLYKSCRQMDRMMNTSYFHEDNFVGILKKVDTTLKQSIAVAKTTPKTGSCSPQSIIAEINIIKDSTKNSDFSPKVVFSTTSTPFKIVQSSLQNSNTSFNTAAGSQKAKAEVDLEDEENEEEDNPKDGSDKVLPSASNSSLQKSSSRELEKTERRKSESVPNIRIEKKPKEPSSSGNTEAQNDSLPSAEEVQEKVPAVEVSPSKNSVRDGAISTESLTEKTPSKSSLASKNVTTDTPAASEPKIDKPPPPASKTNPEKDESFSNESVNSQHNSKSGMGNTSTPSRRDRAKRHQQSELLISAVACLEKASDKCSVKKVLFDEDSGNFSRNENGDSSSISIASPNSEDTSGSEKVGSDGKSVSSSSIILSKGASTPATCALLCHALREQLMLCAEEIQEKLLREDLDNVLREMEGDEESPIDVSTSEETGKTTEDERTETPTTDISGPTTTHGDKSADSDTEPESESETETSVQEEKVIDVKLPEESAKAPEESLAPTVATEPSKSPEPTESNEAIKAPEPAEPLEVSIAPEECFEILATAPKTHKFYSSTITPKNPKSFLSAVSKEHHMLKTSVPPTVWVKVFEDRMDLLSVMIEGPKKTPYEDGLFFFDIQLPNDYPKSPPLCHYISFCNDRLNPNLYDDGKVCVSLLGTWTGRGTEVWTKSSTLLQLIVSIQGLILVPEPYFNEAGYEKQKGTQQGDENSRMYNEMVILKFIQATSKVITDPPPLFEDIIKSHYKQKGLGMYRRYLGYMELSKGAWKIETTVGSSGGGAVDIPQYDIPEFPLLPASRGFCITLEGILQNFYNVMSKNIFEIEHKEVSCETRNESNGETTTKTLSSVNNPNTNPNTNANTNLKTNSSATATTTTITTTSIGTSTERIAPNVSLEPRATLAVAEEDADDDENDNDNENENENTKTKAKKEEEKENENKN